MDKGIVLSQIDGPVARVTLNRPEVHNAFNDEMLIGITEALHRFSADPAVRMVIITGAGRSFCAGADLHWMKKVINYSFEENLADSRLLSDMLRSVDHCPKPVIGRINGAAIGGGTGLVAACDIAVANENAVFAFTETKLGLAPAVIAPYLMRRMGARPLREYFLTGQRFSSSLAEELGLVNYTASAEELDARIQTIVEMILSGGPDALAASKELIRATYGKSISETCDYTIELIARLRCGKEGQEGMNSFLDKRKPRWFADS